MYIYKYIYIYLHACIHTIQSYIYTFIHAYIHTERHSDKHTDSQTDRLTDRQKHLDMYVRTDMRRYIHKRNVQALAGRQAAEKQQQQLQKDMKEPSLP